MKLLGVNAGTTTVCRTIDKVDIFGDNSGVALYRLDGNANDESGNYHGTETAITYGGGAYERGAVFNGTSSQIVVPTLSPTMKSISFWASRDVVEASFLAIVGGADESFIGFGQTSTTMRISINATVGIDLTVPIIVAGVMNHYCFVWTTATNIATYVNGTFVGNTSVGGYQTTAITYIGRRGTALWHKGKLDQVRIFNRAITATEVATLYAECEPTSTVSVDSNVLNQAVAHYKLDGNALDSTGNYNGTATSMTYADGRFGQAGVFNGSTSMSTIPQTFISTTTDNTAFSFSLWVKFNALPDATYYKTIFYSSTVDGYAPIRLMVRYVSAGLFSIDIARLYNTTAYYNTAVATNVSLATGTYYHLAFTYNIGRTVSLYKDGVALATNVSLGSSASVSGTTIYQTLGLGQYAPIGTNNYSNYSLNGSIDQVRIYNKALTATDVTALYNEALPASTVDTVQPLGDTSVKAFYQFNGDATDATGVYNGIATGTPTYTAGKFGQALISSNTSTNYVSTANIPNGNIRTISVWAYPTALPTDATFHTLYGAVSSSAQTTNTAIIRYVSAGLYAIEVYFNVGDTRYYTTTNPQTAIALNTWTHFVFMIESDNKISVYKNGTLVVKSTATTSGSVPYTGAINLGQYNPNGSNNQYTFRGNIDQLRIFDKALISAEAQAIYSESSYAKTTLPTVELDPFLDNSCKALYKFDNNCLDAYGQYDGTATNVTYGTGKFGQCATFDNTQNKYIVFTGLQNSFTINSFSYSLWFNSTLSSSTNTHPLVDMAPTSAGTTLFYIRIVGSVLKLYTGATVDTASTTTLIANRWYHLAVSYNNGISKVYLDGRLDLIVSTPHACASFGFVDIGALHTRFPSTTGYSINGSIDQFRMFNKVLTPMEVASLYNETTPLEEPMHSLVDPFKDGSGKALYRLEGNALDESGNYNGTATSVTYGAGIAGRCFVGNATSARVDIGTTIFNPNMNTFAISMWFKTASIPAGNNLPFWKLSRLGFNLSTDTNTTSYPNRITFSINDTSSNWIKIYPDTDTVLNEWTHVVVNYVNNSSMRMFINGVLQNTQVNNQFGMHTSATTYSSVIGAGNNNGTYLGFFNGSIDQFRVFSRVLTAGEVQALYTEGA